MQVGPHDEQDVLLKKSIHVLQQIQETVTVRHHTRTSLGWIHRAVFEREFGQRLCKNLCGLCGLAGQGSSKGADRVDEHDE